MKNQPTALERALVAITNFYGDQKAERSGVPYINHIHEGLVVMRTLGSSENAMAAYALHPVVQSDTALEQCFSNDDFQHHEALLVGVGDNLHVLMLMMEYRRSANSYLSRNQPSDLRMSPLAEVKDMLIADKVQNYKDFLKYHAGVHPRSADLGIYFNHWLGVLGIPYYRFTELCNIIDSAK